jgi:hypothetical protein
MRRIAVAFAVVVFLLTSVRIDGSERHDITPGEANWHRFRFHVISGAAISVRQNITVSWDNPEAGMLIALFDVDDPTKPTVQAISAGNDRAVSLDIGLLDGSYQVVLTAVVAPTPLSPERDVRDRRALVQATERTASGADGPRYRSADQRTVGAAPRKADGRNSPITGGATTPPSTEQGESP